MGKRDFSKRRKSSITLVNIGYSNFVARDKIAAILKPDSSPVRRLIKDAKQEKTLVDASVGHKTRSVILLENRMLFLSALLPETISERFGEAEGEA